MARLHILFFIFLYLCAFVCAGPNEMLFTPFQQNSVENIDLFKTKIFKLIEAQNQYFEIIQQKRPSTGDYEYAKFDVVLPQPAYEMPDLNNQKLLSIPQPNLPSNSSQLLVSLDYNFKINLWQFKSEYEVLKLVTYDLKYKDYNCIKLRSFILAAGHRGLRSHFRLHLVGLFHHPNKVDSDMIIFLIINGYQEGSNVVITSPLYEEQLIKFEQIIDFDLMHLAPHKIYLSLIQSSMDSNFKYELSLYYWSLHGQKFDKIVSQISDYIFNANRVKLAQLDGYIYLICAYQPTYDFGIELQSNIINVFQYIENVDIHNGHSSKLVFISAINNYTWANEVYHLPGVSDFFFMLKNDDIDVYWWDGHSLIYYDTLLERNPIAFAVHKLPEQPPLILSSDGIGLNLYYKEYSKFIHHRLDLSIKSGYALEQIEILTFKQKYYVWLKLAEVGDFSWETRSYSQFVRVQSRQPELNEEIYNLETCLVDLRNRIEGEIRTTTSLTRQSKDLLVITPEKPIIEVDVIVNDTFKTQRTEPGFRLMVPIEKISHGNSVIKQIETTRARLKLLSNRIAHSVMLKSVNQTIVSPLVFSQIEVDNLFIDSINSNFFLNDHGFEHYANNCLTVNTDQVIESTPFIMANGARVDSLFASQVNGVDLKSAVLVQGLNKTQFISGQHYYDSVQLGKGTTAPVLNDIRLVDVVQDIPLTQLVRGRKQFVNLTTNEISIDTLFNEIDFKQFLSQVVWLDNPNIKLQTLSGNGAWYFMSPVTANYLSVANKINNKLELQYFINNTAKQDQELDIKGPITFTGYISFTQDLSVSSKINGFNLYDDVILLRGNQDFTKNSASTSHIVFESTTNFGNLTTVLINERFTTNDFLRRVNNLNVESLYMASTMISNKRFHSDLHVLGNVDMDRAVLLNGIDLSRLYFELDTFVSFSTPLVIGELVINGQMRSTQFNQYSLIRVHNRLDNLLLRDRPQTIRMPFSYFGTNPIIVRNLKFHTYRSGLKFPEHFVSLHNQTGQEIIYAKKYFNAPIEIDNIIFASNGTFNEIRFSELYRTMVRVQSETSRSIIKGNKNFKFLTIKGNLYLNKGVINDNFLNQVVRIDEKVEQNVLRKLVFEQVITSSNHFRVKDLNIRTNIYGYNYEQFWNEVVMVPNTVSTNYPATITIANKHFVDSLRVRVVIANGTIGSINFEQLFAQTMTLDSIQRIVSPIYFLNATFKRISNFETINGLDLGFFNSVILKNTEKVHLYGLKYFHNNMHLIRVHAPALINRVHNLTHLVENSLLRFTTHAQVINTKHVYLQPVAYLNLTLPVNQARINDIPLSRFVMLNSKALTFESEIMFENLYRIGNLNVNGLINQCSLPDLIRKSIYRNPDLTFNLKGTYIVPRIVIQGNLRFLSLVNDQPNFLPQLVTVDDSRPLTGTIQFSNDVFVKRLYVNNLINRHNLTMLLHDAVYAHMPQRIIGAKYFKKPLQIQGSITQRKGQLRLSGLMNKINITHLLLNTVKSDTQHVIYGNKFFTGKIIFGNVNLGGGLNGLSVPNHYVLRSTNESIHGEVHFTRKVHIHRNLDVKVLNHINVAQFMENAIRINEVGGDLIGTSITFISPIRVHNLTVWYSINDIPVGNLIHRNSHNVQITGKKTFRSPIIVNGELHAKMVNGLDVAREIGHQWIDLRAIKPDNLTGKIIFEDEVHVDNMHINEKINDIAVTNVTHEHLKLMETNLHKSNNVIHESIEWLNRTGRALEDRFSYQQITEIKRFKLHQVLQEPVMRFLSVPHTNGFAHILFGVSILQLCQSYQSRLYSVKDPNEFIVAGSLLPPWNQSNLMLASSMSNNEHFALLFTYSDQCHTQAQSSPFIHPTTVQFWTSSEFYQSMSPQINTRVNRKSYLLQKSSIVVAAKMFSIKQVSYLVIQIKLASALAPAQLLIYRHLDNKLLELSKVASSENVNGFDLIQPQQSIPDIFMSVTMDNASMLLGWNAPQERFDVLHTMVDQVNSITRFILTSDNQLLVAYGSSKASCKQNQPRASATLTIYRVENIYLKLYQRLLTQLHSIQAVHPIQVGSLTYLLLHSVHNIELYQLQGYNGFQLISTLQSPTPIDSITPFWTYFNRLYLAIGTSGQHSVILSTVIAGSGQIVYKNSRHLLENIENGFSPINIS